MPLYTYTPLNICGKYCSFYSTTHTHLKATSRFRGKDKDFTYKTNDKLRVYKTLLAWKWMLEMENAHWVKLPNVT